MRKLGARKELKRLNKEKNEAKKIKENPEKWPGSLRSQVS